MPRQMVVTMILNEVNHAAVDGGPVGRYNVRREKPEFLLVTNSQADCKKVVDTFHSIFTRDRSKCKKESYDVTFLHSDNVDNKLSTSVDNHISSFKTERRTVSRKNTSIESILENNSGDNDLLVRI